MSNSTYAIAGQMAAPPAVKNTQVRSEIERLDSTMDSVIGVVDALLERLSPVLLAEPPAAGSDKNVEEMLVPYADSVRAIRYRAVNVVRRLESALERLEV